MKKRCSMSLTVIIITAICAIAAAVSVHFLGPDNAVEEVAEDVIQTETGINVDLPSEVSSPAAASGVKA